MNDIVLAITPPFNDNYLPIALGIVKSLLKDKYKVKCFDLRLDFKEKVFSYSYDLFNAAISEDWYNEKTKIILDENPKVVAFTIYSSSLNITVELCRYIKKADPKIKIVLAGPAFIYGFEFDKETYKCCDYVYQGEAETGAREFFTNIIENKPVKIFGVWIKDKDGNFNFTGSRERLMDLDKIPMPDYSDFERGIREGYYFELPVEFSRGCSYRCTFCDAVFDQPGRALMIYQKFRTGQRMFEEVYKLFKEYNLKEFIFVDDSFVCSRGSRKALLEFCDLLTEHNMNIRWKVYGVRITQFLDEKDIDKLVKAGLREIRIGLESGSPAVREDMGKEPSKEITDTYINSFLKYASRDKKNVTENNVQVNFFMMYNYPSENAQHFQETIDWIKRDGELSNIIGFTPFNVNNPYLASRAKDHNFKHDNFGHFMWTSNNSNFMIRFSRFVRLIDLFKNNKKFFYDVPDICFTKNYIRTWNFETEKFDMKDEISNTLDKYLDKKYITQSLYSKSKKLEVGDWINFEK
tara:strand:+ start:792 stop:2354 length:1563 start_codon:yes stop_codon:yes gene_type:complete